MKLLPFHKLILFLAFALPVTGISQGHLIDSLHKVVNSAKDDTTRVNAMNDLSGALTDISNYRQADSVVLSTVQLAEKIGFKPGLCTAYANSGWISYSKGDYPRAIACYLEEMK